MSSVPSSSREVTASGQVTGEPVSMTSPTSTEATPQSSGGSSTMGSIKSGFKKLGHALDSGVSSFMRELGGNIRVNCPSCTGTMLAPPNEYVECPKCHHQFMSPTASERGAQVGLKLKKEAEETWAAKQTSTPSGKQSTNTP